LPIVSGIDDNGRREMPRRRTIRMSPETDVNWHPLWVNEHPYSDTDFETPVVLRKHLQAATATDLIAYMRARELTEFLISDDPEEIFDPDYATPIDPVFVNRDGQLEIRLDLKLGIDFTQSDDAEVVADLRRLLAPVLRRHGMLLAEGAWTAPNIASLWFSFSPRGRTVADLARAAEEVIALTRALNGGTLTRDSVRDLVLAGHLGALLGLTEGPWLDVKIQLYDVSTGLGKISLAQSVAAFANGHHGGLVVFGLGTKKRNGGEIISSLNPVPADDALAVRYLKAIDSILFPPPDLMTIKVVEGPGGNFLLIDVPPQPGELKPFLVHGVVVEGKVQGSFISIVTRRDEGALPTRPESIHSSLAAGRALLRGAADSREDLT
jgi:hypothetical protein